LIRAFFLAFALTRLPSPRKDAASVVTAHLKAPAFAMDGKKVCPLGTSAPLHPVLRHHADPITDGAADL
jgi:hypothetical protein